MRHQKYALFDFIFLVYFSCVLDTWVDGWIVAQFLISWMIYYYYIIFSQFILLFAIIKTMNASAHKTLHIDSVEVKLFTYSIRKINFWDRN